MISSSENQPGGAWALRLPAAAASTLTGLRLASGVEVAEDRAAGDLWLRGRTADEGLAAALGGVPATARYAWLPDGQLRLAGELLASGKLPALEWQPLRAWARVELPVARLAAAPPARVALRLVPSAAWRAANAAVYPLDELLAWMLRAPEVRLARLRFAASGEGRALVLGAPLPPLVGRACVEEGGVILPAGCALAPAVSSVVVRRLLGAPDGAVIFWDAAGPRLLSAELFVPAIRGAARATAVESSIALPA